MSALPCRLLLGPLLLPCAIGRLLGAIAGQFFRAVWTLVRPGPEPLAWRQATNRARWAQAITFADLPEEDRCPHHPAYPGIGEHAWEPTWRPSVLTGVLGSIGRHCARCGAARIGTPFLSQQVDWLAQRGMRDRIPGWVAGTWAPELAGPPPRRGGAPGVPA